MFENPVGYECERKFLLDHDRAQAVWSIATRELRSREQPGHPVHVRTTYFDTADLACHRSSFGPIRRRLRVREYGPILGPPSARPPGRCYVELKQSSAGLRHKVRIAVAPEEAAARLAVLAGAEVIPCVATWYRRRAFVDLATRMRLTLDDNLYLCRPRPLGALADLDPRDVLARGPSFVLELKLVDAAPAWLTDAIGDLDEATDFSKFLLGMSVLEGEQVARPIRQSCTG